MYECEHALCLVHLLRDLVFQAEDQGAVRAADLKDLLLSMKQATQQAREQGKRWLDPLEVLDWEIAFLRLLGEGDHVTPRATAPPGTKGRIKQSAARNLLDRLRKHQKAVSFKVIHGAFFSENLPMIGLKSASKRFLGHISRS